MDTALPHKFPFILDRNLVKANWKENRICTSCDTVALDFHPCTAIHCIIPSDGTPSDLCVKNMHFKEALAYLWCIHGGFAIYCWPMQSLSKFEVVYWIVTLYNHEKQTNIYINLVNKFMFNNSWQ